MKRILFAMLLALGACGRADAVKAYESWADDACLCKDADCVTKLETRLTDLGKKYSGEKIPRVDMEAILAASQRGGQCLVEAHKNAAKN